MLATDSRLAALLTLLSFYQDKPTEGLATARQWLELSRANPEIYQLSETTLIASACLRHAESRPLGEELLVRVSVFSASQAKAEALRPALVKLEEILGPDHYQLPAQVVREGCGVRLGDE